MSKPLTTAGDVTCGHQGKAVLVAANKLKVSGQSVLVKLDVVGKTVGGCTTPVASDSSGPVSAPCLSVQSVTAGESTKLKVGGAFVMLDDQLKGTTDGMLSKATPLSALAGSAVQSKLKSV